MGQRHQLFVIARPKPGLHYRSFAAVNHQWLYGMSALKHCLRLVRIFSDEANRLALKQELAFGAKYDDTASPEDIEASDEDIKAWRKCNGFDSPVPCPFPFITTCLMLGASCDPDTGSSGIVHEERFSMEYDESPNDNGITVIDITDLTQVRYCFVDFFGMESKRKVPLHTPLDGWTYLRAYYQDSDTTVQSNIIIPQGLEKFELVEKSSLADCWPDGRWEDTDTDSADNSVDASNFQIPISQPQESTPADAPPSSLRSVALSKMLGQFLSGSETDTTLLDYALLISGFKRDMLLYLSEHAEALDKSPMAIQLLEKALAGETVVDLTPFWELPPTAVRALLQSNAFKDIKVLNLSGTKAVSDKEITETIGSLKQDLDALYLLVEPDRETEDPMKTMDAVRKFSGSQISLPKRLVPGSVFSQGLRIRPWHVQNDTLSLAPAGNHFWSSFPVIQMLFKGMLGTTYSQITEDNRHPTNFFLGDAFLSPVRFATGLMKIIQYQMTQSIENRLRTDLGIPLIFASAPSSLKTMDSIEISPIPAEAYYVLQKRHCDGDYATPLSRMRDLTPETWTAVVTHYIEYDGFTFIQQNIKLHHHFKVALVRSKKHIQVHANAAINADDLEIVDLEKFLEITSPEHAADVKNAVAALEKSVNPSHSSADGELVSFMDANEVVSNIEASFF